MTLVNLNAFEMELWKWKYGDGDGTGAGIVGHQRSCTKIVSLSCPFYAVLSLSSLLAARQLQFNLAAQA